MSDYIVLDVASAPIEGAADFIEEPEHPANYRDPDKIAAWLAEARAKLLAKAALDLDLARVTCIGISAGELEEVHVMRDDTTEGEVIACVGELLCPANAVAVTFAGRSFDLALLQRRALYLGVPFPKLDLSKYRSPHIDLCELLSGQEPHRRHSLSFYCQRLGWKDLIEKPLEGEEEALVFSSGRWDDLAASVRRDVTATRRLAIWAGVLPEGGAQ